MYGRLADASKLITVPRGSMSKHPICDLVESKVSKAPALSDSLKLLLGKPNIIRHLI